MIKSHSPFKILIISLEFILMAGCVLVAACWMAGHPLFFTETGPVMAAFTAISLLILTGVRVARKLLTGWPMTLSLALLGLVFGGNLSTILLQTGGPANLMQSFPSIVLTSVMTACGLILFCLYEFLIVLRETPDSTFILDDILIHLALVPGGLSLLGHLLNNPVYMSIGDDPRVGISILEMVFMAMYAAAALLSNPQLFLWRFLARGWTNRMIFAALFANQFIAPIIVLYSLGGASLSARKPGIEMFVMLAGVAATLSFLLIQAYLHRRSSLSADIAGTR